MAPIQIQGLVKRYGPVTAVDNLSFEVQPGTVTGFLGPNGAGKTTTLRMLLGLVTPDAGSATINGRRYAELAEPLHQVGAVLEAPASIPAAPRGRTCASRPCRPTPTRRGSTTSCDLVGLADAADRRVGGFSLGMRQRLGLATALLADPELLILDEPANGLDPEGIRWLRGLLRGFAAEGGTVLVSSHMLAEVAQTIDSRRDRPPRPPGRAGAGGGADRRRHRPRNRLLPPHQGVRVMTTLTVATTCGAPRLARPAHPHRAAQADQHPAAVRAAGRLAAAYRAVHESSRQRGRARPAARPR